MKLAGLHPDEQRRLQSLRSSGLLNSGKEERFDRLTRLARSLYNLPVASISLVGEDLLHIKSCAGLDVDTVPRDISFCAHTILQTDSLIVNDMQQDERFHDNPLVIEAPFIRFYAGYPVQLPDGATVGSFCLMDHQPRSFSAHEMQILSDLAAIVEDEFKVLDAATSDELTGLFNRRGFLTLAEYALLTAQRRHEPVSLAFVDLDRFKHINDTWGHEEGDRALIAIADLMKAAFRESDILARQGGTNLSFCSPIPAATMPRRRWRRSATTWRVSTSRRPIPGSWRSPGAASNTIPPAIPVSTRWWPPLTA